MKKLQQQQQQHIWHSLDMRILYSITMLFS